MTKPKKPSSPLPADVAWDPQHEVVSYLLVPCKPTGYRIVERKSSLEEAAVFGEVSDRDLGSLQLERVISRLERQATKG